MQRLAVLQARGVPKRVIESRLKFQTPDQVADHMEEVLRRKEAKAAAAAEEKAPKKVTNAMKLKIIATYGLPLLAKTLFDYGKSILVDPNSGYVATPELYAEAMQQLKDAALATAEKKVQAELKERALEALADVAPQGISAPTDALVSAIDRIPGSRIIPKHFKKKAAQAVLHMIGFGLYKSRKRINHAGGTGPGGRGRPSAAQLRARKLFALHYGGKRKKGGDLRGSLRSVFGKKLF